MRRYSLKVGNRTWLMKDFISLQQQNNTAVHSALTGIAYYSSFLLTNLKDISATLSIFFTLSG
jgi:hypothetical protein